MTSNFGWIGAVLCLVTLGGCASSGSAVPSPSKAVAAKPARTAQQITMDELLDNPRAHAVLKKHAPTVADHPQVSMARGMTLADVAGYAEAGLTAQTVQAIVDDVNKL